MVLDFEVEVTCFVCHQPKKIKVRKADYEAWQEGAHIQNVMSYLNVSERELMISRTCGPCFDRLFPDDEDDEY